MAKETKTIQCYPDDNQINKECELQSSFGWELIGNKRCREETPNGEYVKIKTFHKLTFSREKNTPWYKRVTELESQYNRILSSQPIRPSEPQKRWLFAGIGGLIAGIILLVILSKLGGLSKGEVIPSVVLFVCAGLLIVRFIIKTVRYNAYLAQLSSWESSKGQELEKIRKQADSLINANQ